MDRILISVKKYETRASFVPALGLYTIIFKHGYWYIKQISGEHYASVTFRQKLHLSKMSPCPANVDL